MSTKAAAPSNSKLVTCMAWTVLAILFLLPFHTFFTTWAMANFGYANEFRVWKELVILLLSIGCLALLIRDKTLRQQFIRTKLPLLIGLYVILGLLRTGYGLQEEVTNFESSAYGMLGAFRYLVFFLVTWLVAARSTVLQRWWAFAVITPATIVVLFGLLQQFVLDKNFLTHFGYGPDTMPAYQSVDQKAEYLRAQSLLRGPNPLGAYLAFLITILTGMFYKFKAYRFSFGFLIVAASLLLYVSYSRSAWIGLAISLATWILLAIKNKKVLNFVIITGLITFIIAGSVVFALRDNDYIQNTIFHTDETSLATTSTNTVRWEALKYGANDVVAHPLGQGLGSAGPASTHGPSTYKIAENYYIQVAQEVGVIGLMLYLTITALVGYKLFRRRDQLLPQVLFASLIGISAINLVSHAWMDDILSLMWWGLAGIALAPDILKAKHEQNKIQTTEKITR